MSTPQQPSSAMVYTQGFGSSPNYYIPHYDNRAPTAQDIRSPTGFYQPGQIWVFINNSCWILLGLTSFNGETTANWFEISSISGPVQSVVGTANEITVVTALGTATISLPSAIIAPGSLSTTTTITAGTGLTVTAGGADITGDSEIDGNLTLSAVDSKLNINDTAPSTASVGTSAAMTAGEVTITTSACTSTSQIIYSRKTLGTLAGNVSITAQADGSFTLTSDEATETSTFDYLIIN